MKIIPTSSFIQTKNVPVSKVKEPKYSDLVLYMKELTIEYG